jgi:hypothetical protein
VIRTSIYFGVWATLCMAIAIAGFFLGAEVWDSGLSGATIGTSLHAIYFLASFSPVAGVVAGFGWWFFHRRGRQPGRVGYIFIALATLIASHIVVFGALLISADITIPDFFIALTVLFLMHGWLSIPVALAGTLAFVRWNRRRSAV